FIFSWYADADGDGFGAPGSHQLSLLRPPGKFLITELHEDSNGQDDCDDNNPLIKGPTKYYIDYDNDGYASDSSIMNCTVPIGGYWKTEEMLVGFMDCDDTDPNIFRYQEWFQDQDGDGYGAFNLDY